MCVTTSERAVMMRQGSEKATRGRVRTPKVRRLPDENRTGLFRSFFARSALECDASSHRFWAYRLQGGSASPKTMTDKPPKAQIYQLRKLSGIFGNALRTTRSTLDASWPKGCTVRCLLAIPRSPRGIFVRNPHTRCAEDSAHYSLTPFAVCGFVIPLHPCDLPRRSLGRRRIRGLKSVKKSLDSSWRS